MKSRTFTSYVDTGERYKDGRKKYKQIRRVIKPDHPKAEKSRKSIIRLEEAYSEIINTKRLERREWKRYNVLKETQVAYFGNIDLNYLDREKCKAYRNHLLAKGLANATVDLELRFLKHVFLEAKRANKVFVPCPIDKHIFINHSNRRERIITLEEQAVLFPELSIWARRIAETIVNCGIRPGEACKIKKSAVDLMTNTLHLTETKGLRPRSIPFGPIQRQIFIEAMRDSSCEMVFLNSIGAPYNVQVYDYTFKAACDRLGITNLKPHDLRHTFATRLCRSNVNLRKVQYYMGHASIKTTERYTHIDPESREDILIAESFTQNAREMENCHNNRHTFMEDEQE